MRAGSANRWAALAQQHKEKINIMATAPIITVKLEASDEREAIARFIEYTFDKNWVVQDVIDAIRNGSYLEHVRKLVAAQQPRVPDVLHNGHCEHVPDGQYCPYCKEA